MRGYPLEVVETNVDDSLISNVRRQFLRQNNPLHEQLLKDAGDQKLLQEELEEHAEKDDLSS